MKIIGLSGGIASGKNFIAKVFEKNGAMVFDADQEVHDLLEFDLKTFKEIEKIFPNSIIDGKINRKNLSLEVFLNQENLKILEKIIHPKIRQKYQEFLIKAKENKVEMVVLNIPLLLESDGYKCDKIISIILPKDVQKQRFLLREKKKDLKNYQNQLKDLELKFEEIYKKQLKNSQRKEKSDFIIKNHFSKSDVILQVKKIIYEIASKK